MMEWERLYVVTKRWVEPRARVMGTMRMHLESVMFLSTNITHESKVGSRNRCFSNEGVE